MNFLQDILNRVCYRKCINFAKSNNEISLRNALIIGEGSYGTVYQIDKRFALKKLYLQSEEFELIVKTEIESLERFKHKNIIYLIDHVECFENNDSKIAYLLFPFMERGSLRNHLCRRIQNNSIDKLQDVLKSFVDLCSAFRVLHTYTPSYVHQDIKPENVMIDNDGKPILIDFGSVRLADIEITSRNKALSISEEAAQFCTASYRSPELYDPQTGDFLDSRTDIWAVGCLLFAWWFGWSPYESEFQPNGTLRVVECTRLRILAPIPSKKKCSKDDLIIMELCQWILDKELKSRPFITDIITKIEEIIHNQSIPNNIV